MVKFRSHISYISKFSALCSGKFQTFTTLQDDPRLRIILRFRREEFISTLDHVAAIGLNAAGLRNPFTSPRELLRAELFRPP